MPFTTAAQAIEWLDAERANLLEVLRAATDEGWHADVWTMCESLWALYHSRKHYADWIEAQQLGIQAAQWEGRIDAEVRMRNQLARAYYELGELDRADEQLQRTAVLLDAVTDGRLNGMVWETTGLIALARRRPEEAIALFTRARDANVAEGDSHGTAVQTYNLGQALLAGDRFDDALAALAEAERIVSATDDDAMRSRIAIMEGSVHRAAGRPERALECLTMAAQWAGRLGQLAKAEQALILVSELAGECGDPHLQVLATQRLGELRAHLGLAVP
jgi:tetratricopeptide (TPR) repeat protein